MIHDLSFGVSVGPAVVWVIYDLCRKAITCFLITQSINIAGVLVKLFFQSFSPDNSR